MTRYVVDASVVLALLAGDREVSTSRELLAPTLIRSEILDTLYRAVRAGELTADVARDRLAAFATLKMRFLGDKVLRRQAWIVAEQLGWDSTRDAEYVALAQLQADAFVTLDRKLAAAVAGLVATPPVDVLFEDR